MHTSTGPVALSREARPARARSTAALAVLALAAAGCAGAQKPATANAFEWPLPPDRPRVRHVRSFAGSADFDTSGWGRFMRAIAGKRSGLAVQNPTALALSPDDRYLFVACPNRSTVMVFDRQAQSVSEMRFDEQYIPATPYGLAVDADGTIFVADESRGVVRGYELSGKFKVTVGKGLLERPVGIAVDRKRRILYVIDGGNRNSSRQVLDAYATSDGRHLRTIGTSGYGPGQFLFPTNVAVAPDGNVYVADTLNSRIQVFDPEGTLVTMFGFLGDRPGAFGKPKGLAFDAFGNLHVVDSQLSYVQVFNAKQMPLMAYGGPGNHPALMALPNGIAIDSKNEIFVADFIGNQVKQYQLFNTTAEDSFGAAQSPNVQPQPATGASPAAGASSVPAAAPRP